MIQDLDLDARNYSKTISKDGNSAFFYIRGTDEMIDQAILTGNTYSMLNVLYTTMEKSEEFCSALMTVVSQYLHENPQYLSGFLELTDKKFGK